MGAKKTLTPVQKVIDDSDAWRRAGRRLDAHPQGAGAAQGLFQRQGAEQGDQPGRGGGVRRGGAGRHPLSISLIVGNDLDLAVLVDADAQVGGAQVDADDRTEVGAGVVGAGVAAKVHFVGKARGEDEGHEGHAQEHLDLG